MAQYWYSSARGRRPSMEDMHVVTECPTSKWILFAVCDGHGGTGVVKLLEQILPTRILKALALASAEQGGPNVPVRASYLRQCMKLTIISLDSEIEKTLKSDSSGSTLILMAYQPLTRQIVLANVGDSRAVLSLPTIPNPPIAAIGAGAAVPGRIGFAKANAPIVKTNTSAGGGVRVMGASVAGVGRRLIETKDHKPTDKDEMLRVMAAGSFVSKSKRVGGILALSRAMGDFSLKKSLKLPYDPVNGAVCAMPDVQVGYISPVSSATAILACDGIWDVMSSQEAADIAETSLADKTNPAETLVHTAFQKQSTDNLTCLVVRLHPRIP